MKRVMWESRLCTPQFIFQITYSISKELFLYHFVITDIFIRFIRILILPTQLLAYSMVQEII